MSRSDTSDIHHKPSNSGKHHCYQTNMLPRFVCSSPVIILQVIFGLSHTLHPSKKIEESHRDSRKYCTVPHFTVLCYCGSNLFAENCCTCNPRNSFATNVCKFSLLRNEGTGCIEHGFGQRSTSHEGCEQNTPCNTPFNGCGTVQKQYRTVHEYTGSTSSQSGARVSSTPGAVSERFCLLSS